MFSTLQPVRCLVQPLLLACNFSKAAQAPVAAAVVKKDWNAIKISPDVAEAIPTSTGTGSAFRNDLRSTSGLGVGDGIKNHTDKWLQGESKSPLEYMADLKPVKVKGLVVASHGSDDPALGCPVEYIDLRGTTEEKPAVCKYTGNKYYSDSWKSGGHH